ncbi:hypothetical protein A3D85_03060 [Candidatus Amesbacteria bacterium RIFCSPHIGHO2_02_FULL_47_9]|nr:MAG: hypothetical protein A3D85_03060 [Candidatus Amesbacteria bacterium RIFCSPHIGHO2_02_FULL_47_9]
MGFWPFAKKESSWQSGKNAVGLEIGEDMRQSEAYAQYMKCIGWEVEKIPGTRCQIFVRRLGVLGAVAKLQRTRLPLPWTVIDKILRKNRVILMRVEPLNCNFSAEEFEKAGYKSEREPLRATKTIRINLNKNPQELLFSFKRARSWINKLVKNKHKVEIGNFDKFFEVWKKATRIQNIWSSSKKDFDNLWGSFGENAFSITIDDICGCLILMHDKVAYYYYGAALPAAKGQNLPYLTIWEAMREARKRGAKVWDWEGVYDPRFPNPKWKGFTQFKNTFGGEEVWFPGSFGKMTLRNLFPTT